MEVQPESVLEPIRVTGQLMITRGKRCPLELDSIRPTLLMAAQLDNAVIQPFAVRVNGEPARLEAAPLC